ncbi:MAG: hypothetical protein NVS2B7_36180 [Herpetosiphon sp.]
MTSAQDVAQWMVDRVEQFYMHHELIAKEIQERFGQSFVAQSETGTLAITKPVLKVFNRLTKDRVIWVRGGQYWRLREPGDPPRSREVDW